MTQPSFKDAITICKSIMRNGFDAHIVNTPLQHTIIEKTGLLEVDLCTNTPPDELAKMFLALEPANNNQDILGILRENEYTYRFYKMNLEDAVSPESTVCRMTPTIAAKLQSIEKNDPSASQEAKYPGFIDHMHGCICFAGQPDQALRSNYLLAIRAMRLAANFDLPIEQNTWVAIVSASQRIIDYVAVQQFMDEWRCVSAENMWHFVQLLFDSQVIHGLIPEVAGLARIRQTKNDSGIEESVFDHTIECMRHYPEEEFNHDWLGTFAALFHDIGKLYTAEFYQGKWTFYQHHRVGAKVARIILRRLRFPTEDIELICQLVGNHMRFQFMMTDKGIRRFKAEEGFDRMIALSRANIIARDDNYTAFNHNTKYLKRAETPEQMLEPLLNGNEIMEVTGLAPGPHVGVLRQSLLQAQIAGKVTNVEEAAEFVRAHKHEITV